VTDFKPLMVPPEPKLHVRWDRILLIALALVALAAAAAIVLTPAVPGVG
jgi:hypothetical protein